MDDKENMRFADIVIEEMMYGEYMRTLHELRAIHEELMKIRMEHQEILASCKRVDIDPDKLIEPAN